MKQNPGARFLYTYSTEAVKSELGITDSGWIDLINDTTGTGTVRYRKVGSTVEVQGQYRPATSGDRIMIGILPKGYRPAGFTAVAALPNHDYSNFFALRVLTNGSVEIKSNSAKPFNSGELCGLHIQYFVD